MKLDDISTIDNMMLKEMQIQIGKQSNSGQIVFLAGSPGSGKNWVINNMTDIKNRFKIFDIDDVKEKVVSYDKLMAKFLAYIESHIEILKTKENLSGSEDDTLRTYKQITHLLKGPHKKTFLTNNKVQDVLHEYLTVSEIMPKKIENLLHNIIDDPTKLPNIAFNAPLRTSSYPNTLLELLMRLGYQKENVNVLWVVSSIADTMHRAAMRGKTTRGTNQRYMVVALKQVSNTMASIISGESVLSDKISRVYVVYNSEEHIERYNNSDVIKKFKYDTIKIGDTSKLNYIFDVIGDSNDTENDDE